MIRNIKTNKDRGFTIVELLVVIVVIGILAAITIVSYTGVTSKANTAANKSNASSVLSAAMGVYAEYGSFPPTNTSSTLMITYLNSGVTKVPATLVVTSTTVTSSPGSQLSYRLQGTTGVCVGYWDFDSNTTKYLYGGTATSDNGTNCTNS